MWWLIPIAIGAKIVYDLVCDEPEIEHLRQKTVLECNFERLGTDLVSQNRKRIAIIGQPGAGKSSLLKKMTNGRVRPLPVIGTHTDATNWSDDIACSLLSFYKEIIFVDIPGYDTASHPVDMFCLYFPWDKFDEFVFVVNGKIHDFDRKIYRTIAGHNKRVCVVRSFSENMNSHDKSLVEIDLRNNLFSRRHSEVFFCSNRSGQGIDNLCRYLRL